MAVVYFRTLIGAQKRAAFESAHSPNGLDVPKPRIVEPPAYGDFRFKVRPRREGDN